MPSDSDASNTPGGSDNFYRPDSAAVEQPNEQPSRPPSIIRPTSLLILAICLLLVGLGILLANTKYLAISLLLVLVATACGVVGVIRGFHEIAIAEDHRRTKRARERERAAVGAAVAAERQRWLAARDFKLLDGIDFTASEIADHDPLYVPTLPVGPEAEAAARSMNEVLGALFTRLGPPPDSTSGEGNRGPDGLPPGASPDVPTSNNDRERVSR